MVLNTGPLDWESSDLTTRPLLRNENDFEAVLVNFCCYEYNNIIILPMLLRQFRSEDQHKDNAGVMLTH